MKKLSKSKNSKKYLEEKYNTKSKPISKLLKNKLYEASKSANEKIKFNNSIYNDSNAHSHETILIDKQEPVKKLVLKK